MSASVYRMRPNPFRTALDEAHARWDWRKLDYFQRLEAGTLDVSTLHRVQAGFRHAVVGFTRPMGLLAARAERAEVRAVLYENCWEEHGRGDLSRSHRNSFDALLGQLGIEATAHPASEAFIDALCGVCAFRPVNTGLAMLGLIEHQFAYISAMHGRALAHLPDLAHYTTHQELDLEHAESFFGLVEPAWPESADEIHAGLELGGYLFTRLYRDLSEVSPSALR